MKIEEFTNDGKIVFVFDQPMEVPTRFKDFSLKTDSIQPWSQTRRLATQESSSDSDTDDNQDNS